MKTKAILLLFFICLIIYSNSLGGKFLIDDNFYIVNNVHVRDLKDIPFFFTNRSATTFARLQGDIYRPLTPLSFAIDYSFWKLNSFGYHLTNVLSHSFNVILLFLFLWLAFKDVFLAFFASAFFASHPIQTEVVAYISGRPSVLFLFFYLLALIFYVLFLERSKKIYLIYSLIFYLASLFSKEMAITLPLILIAYDIHFFNKDPFRKKVYRYAPYIILTIFFVFTRSIVLKKVSQCGWWGGSPYYTFLTMSRVLIEYLKLLISPLRLCAFYEIDISTSICESRVLAALASLMVLVIALPVIFKRSRITCFCICWFFITLLPVSNMIPLRALMAERFLYLPSIGFSVLLALFIEKIQKASVWPSARTGRAIGIWIATILIILYSVRTMIRNEDWKDPMTISKTIVEADPLNSWGLGLLGASYSEEGRYEEAIKTLKKAIYLAPNYAFPRTALGVCYLKVARYDDAVEVLNEALKVEPDDIQTIYCLGAAYAYIKRHNEAIEKFNVCLKMDPYFINAYLNIGGVYELMLKYDKALEEYNKAAAKAKSRRDIAISYMRIGDLYLKMRDKVKAKEYYEKAAGICDRGLEDFKKAAIDKIKTYCQRP